MLLSILLPIHYGCLRGSIIDTLKPTINQKSATGFNMCLKNVSSIQTHPYSFLNDKVTCKYTNFNSVKTQRVQNLRLNQIHSVLEKEQQLFCLKHEAIQSIKDLKLLIRTLGPQLSKLPLILLQNPVDGVDGVVFNGFNGSLITTKIEYDGNVLRRSDRVSGVYASVIHDLINDIKQLIRLSETIKLCTNIISDYICFVPEIVFKETSYDIVYLYTVEDVIYRARCLIMNSKAQLDLIEEVFQAMIQS